MKALVRGGLALILVLGAGMGLGCSAEPQARVRPTAVAGKIWAPKPGVSWQWQLSGKVDTSVAPRCSTSTARIRPARW